MLLWRVAEQYTPDDPDNDNGRQRNGQYGHEHDEPVSHGIKLLRRAAQTLPKDSGTLGQWSPGGSLPHTKQAPSRDHAEREQHGANREHDESTENALV